MNSNFTADNIVTNNCILVKGPDNKLCLLLPVTPEVVEKINATHIADVRDMHTETPADQPAQASVEGSPENSSEHDDVQTPKAIQEWTVTRSVSSNTSTHRLTHRLDHRTYIELCDYHDGLGSVRRSVKPRRGKAVKDTPMSDQPITACLERIREWIAENPQLWTKYDDPGSASAMSRRRKRMKLYNSLFARR